MAFSRFLIFVALAAVASIPAAQGAWELKSCTITLYPDTGDAYVEGLPATKTVNLLGETTTVLADGDGRARKVIDGAGKVTTQTYDANGNLLSRRDANGAGTDYAYDELNRRTSETDAQIAGKTRSYTYDLADRLLTATDPLGIVTTFGYDLRDRKIAESTPMNGSVNRLIQYGYDGRGHMTSLTDANSAVTLWTFDSAGRQISKTYANGDHRSMAYDAAARLVKLTDENGHDITSIYDLAGRLTSKHFAADNTTDTFVYDAASRMTSATKGRYADTLTYAYDTAGRLATETHPDGTVLHLSYDEANRLANLSLGGTGVPPVYSVDYAFDGRGLLSTVTSGDYSSRYEYRANGQPLSTIHSRLSTPQGDILRADRTYDAGARLLGVANTAANGDQAGVVYTLGADDQRLTATEESGEKWDYGYDGLKQLVSAKKTDTGAVVVPPLDQNYTFDPMGNRSAYTESGTAVAYTKNNANQYTSVVASGLVPRTSNPVYDANGNMLTDGVKNYTWDAENQLVSVTPVAPLSGDLRADFTYDWRMRRNSKTTYVYTSGAWAVQKITKYKYREWNLIEETVANASGVIGEVKRYVWGNDLSGSLDGAGGVGGLLSMSHLTPATSTPDTYFYAFDGNGNVRALVKADAVNPATSAITARYAYDGFGKEVAVTGADADKNAFRFSTKQLDAETGMNYYGYRFYAADAGRWINRDPILEKGGISIYSMVGNDAIYFSDCLGLDFIPGTGVTNDGYDGSFDGKHPHLGACSLESPCALNQSRLMQWTMASIQRRIQDFTPYWMNNGDEVSWNNHRDQFLEAQRHALKCTAIVSTQLAQGMCGCPKDALQRQIDKGKERVEGLRDPGVWVPLQTLNGLERVMKDRTNAEIVGGSIVLATGVVVTGGLLLEAGGVITIGSTAASGTIGAASNVIPYLPATAPIIIKIAN